MALAALSGCGRSSVDTDVIVVGAGIAGIAAALEAADGGARVQVLERGPIAGGHAVMAGGFALVDTPLQRARGHRDSPEIAAADLLAWGEEADEVWVRHYAAASGPEVHDWLTGMGVEFAVLLDTPEDSVPRFHFTRGSAVNVIVAMLRRAYAEPRIDFVFNSPVSELRVRRGAVTGVVVTDTSSGEERELTAHAVVLATGGFQSNLQRVREHWPDDRPRPGRILIGSGRFADGAGLTLASDAGAALTRLERQVTFVSGLPNPRKPERGLLVQNPAAIWIDARGRRFTNEAAPSKFSEKAVLARRPAEYWMVFDQAGLRQLRVRGASWLTRETIADEIFGGAHVRVADSLRGLAVAMGVPAPALRQEVARYNRYIGVGTDLDFDRFSPTRPDRAAAALTEAPYYALQLFPMTRKSMGGVAVDTKTQVIDDDGEPIAGLFAAGELTGVVGINGRYGQSGTFLGPSVFTGRLAGRAAAATLPDDRAVVETGTRTDAEPDEADVTLLDAAALPALIDARGKGNWHFTAAHKLVLARASDCTDCHSAAWPTAPVANRAQRLAQLDSCARCH